MNIKVRNYIYTISLIIVTFLVTILLSKFYTDKKNCENIVYKYANSISVNEFDEYIIENPDTIMYISGKYSLANELFEKAFIAKIEHLNLKSKLIFVDFNDNISNFVYKLNKKYNMDINFNNDSMIILFVDGNLKNYIAINNSTDVDNFINYGVFE